MAGWYFTNAEDDKMVVTEDNTASGETLVPGRGTLVVYLEEAFLDNTADTLSIYAPGILPENESDDVREDTYSYEDADLLPEGKSFARFPDGEGIWIDPVATPGEENMMTEADVQIFRRLTYDQCFEDEQLRKDVTEEICSPLFLHFIGMIEEVDDRNMVDAVVLDILEMIRLEEEENLLTLLVEDDIPPIEEEAPVSDPEPVVPIDVILPVEEVLTEETPVEEVSGDATEAYVEPIMAEEQEEVPQEEIPEAKMEEAPATESLPDTIVAIP